MLGPRGLAPLVFVSFALTVVSLIVPGCVSGPYDPCRGKDEGEECRLCAPDDPDCVETMVLKLCNADGTCGAARLDAGAPD
jgi:hypothetical protein